MDSIKMYGIVPSAFLNSCLTSLPVTIWGAVVMESIASSNLVHAQTPVAANPLFQAYISRNHILNCSEPISEELPEGVHSFLWPTHRCQMLTCAVMKIVGGVPSWSLMACCPLRAHQWKWPLDDMVGWFKKKVERVAMLQLYLQTCGSW